MAEQVAIEEGLFTWPSDDPRLLGSQCQDCGAIIFPMQSGCPRCASDDTKPKELGGSREIMDVDYPRLPT
ncbi:MAG: hypothetical protein Ct9H90mP30_1970 [Actinomycetota bacterium]|nr:MAG: hypothetical protein Ct9H90mP30_1970 [Actinomycetota bacterium]